LRLRPGEKKRGIALSRGREYERALRAYIEQKAVLTMLQSRMGETDDNSPPFQRREREINDPVPAGDE